MNDELMKNLKFAEFLANKGLLTPIVASYKEYRNQQNYPYELKDKRLFKVACIKALCQRQDIEIEKIDAIAGNMVKDLYEENIINNSIIELMKLHNIPKEFEKTVSFMAKILNKEDLDIWLKNVNIGFQERKSAEMPDQKQAKEIQDKKMDKEIKEQIVPIETATTAEEIKNVVKKRVIRKRKK